MSKNSESFFTAGELATLFNIPKQTLLYYDKMNLLTPEFIAENGYRHYSLKQYLTLEVIVNLRKLDIPISKIKEYIENRDIDAFDKLLLEKKCECDEIIEKNLKIKNSLNTVFAQLEKTRSSRLNQITLEFQKEKYFFISDLSKTRIGKKRIEIMAHHNQKAFSKQHFKEKNIGWIINKENFFSTDKANINNACAFFLLSVLLMQEQNAVSAGLLVFILLYGLKAHSTVGLQNLHKCLKILPQPTICLLSAIYMFLL